MSLDFERGGRGKKGALTDEKDSCDQDGHSDTWCNPVNRGVGGPGEDEATQREKDSSHAR